VEKPLSLNRKIIVATETTIENQNIGFTILRIKNGSEDKSPIFPENTIERGKETNVIVSSTNNTLLFCTLLISVKPLLQQIPKYVMHVAYISQGRRA
jgi:hypothetical protein